MLQHAIIAANQFDDNTEITLIALWDGEQEGEVGTGGICHLVKLAAMSGIKVHTISLQPKVEKQGELELPAQVETRNVFKLRS